jgi:hypothetical protein
MAAPAEATFAVIIVRAIALHFLAGDFGLRKDHSRTTIEAVGTFSPPPWSQAGLLSTHIRSPISGRILPFVAGVIGYAVLLILTWGRGMRCQAPSTADEGNDHIMGPLEMKERRLPLLAETGIWLHGA